MKKNHPFEHQWKSQLDQREVSPSDKSWEQLRAKLDTADKKRKRPYYWMAIAASLTISFLAINVFFKSNKIEQTPQIVDVDTPVQKIEQNKNQDVQKGSQQQPIDVVDTKVVDVPVQQEVKKKSVTQESKEPKDDTDVFIKSKAVDAIVADVLQQEKDQNTITEAEVDALLAEATEKIIRQKQFQQPNDISATALLEGVEMELEQSFREKVFKVLKTSYLKTKEAVATRND